MTRQSRAIFASILCALMTALSVVALMLGVLESATAVLWFLIGLFGPTTFLMLQRVVSGPPRNQLPS